MKTLEAKCIAEHLQLSNFVLFEFSFFFCFCFQIKLQPVTTLNTSLRTLSPYLYVVLEVLFYEKQGLGPTILPSSQLG
jgi:hypothetical protein